MVLSRQLNGQSHRPFRSLFFCFVLSIHQLATIRWRFLAHLRPWPESFLQNDSLFIADVVFFQPELVQAHFVIRTGHEQQYEPLDALRSFCFFFTGFYLVLPGFQVLAPVPSQFWPRIVWQTTLVLLCNELVWQRWIGTTNFTALTQFYWVLHQIAVRTKAQ